MKTLAHVVVGAVLGLLVTFGFQSLFSIQVPAPIFFLFSAVGAMAGLVESDV